MELTFDISQFNQWQKNMVHMALVSLLYAEGITYEDLTYSDGVCTLTNPSGESSLTTDDVLAKIIAIQEQVALNVDGYDIA
jgi:hypothetical protein